MAWAQWRGGRDGARERIRLEPSSQSSNVGLAHRSVRVRASRSASRGVLLGDYRSYGPCRGRSAHSGTRFKILLRLCYMSPASYASTARGQLAEIGVPSQRRPVPCRRGWRPPAAARAAAPSRRKAAQSCRLALSAAPKACHLRSSAASGASGRRGLITGSGTGSRSGCTGSPCRSPRGIGR